MAGAFQKKLPGRLHGQQHGRFFRRVLTTERAARPPGSDRDAWGRALDETAVLVLPTIWTYDGLWHVTATPGAELAAASAARAREHYDPASSD